MGNYPVSNPGATNTKPGVAQALQPNPYSVGALASPLPQKSPPPGAPPAAGAGKPLQQLFGQNRTGNYNPNANNPLLQYTQQTPGATQARMNPPAPAVAPDPYGSQSGPTAVEDRYNQRANGTDPGWEYATGRAQDQINRQYAARGGYNSSGAMNSISDMYANATSQREGQLDTLSNEATGAHQNALNSMFTNGLGVANGLTQAGAAGAAGAGGAMTQDQQQQMQLYLAKLGVDQSKTQGEINGLTSIGSLGAKAIGGGK